MYDFGINVIRDVESKTLSYNVKEYEKVINLNVITSNIFNMLDNDNMARICIHSDKDKLTQLMFIGISDKLKMKSHKNGVKDKIIQIIKGNVEIVINNSIKLILKSGELIKIKKNSMVIIRSLDQKSIYQEIVAGPFSSNTNC